MGYSDADNKAHLIEHMARELFIHQDLTPEGAFNRAKEFVEYQYNEAQYQLKPLNQVINVKYLVEETTHVNGWGPINLYIRCEEIKGFEDIVITKFKGPMLGIAEVVEQAARKQLDLLLQKDGQRAGRMKAHKVRDLKDLI